MDHDRLVRIWSLLNKAEWIFAKSMPENPHHYTLRKTWENDSDFVEVVNAIREFGYDEYYRSKWRGKWYKMLDINGYKYWTMGAPVKETILINRKEIKKDHKYDLIAPNYDDVTSDDECIAENNSIKEMIGDISGKSCLDIGCGTGLMFEIFRPSRYVGIDPSSKMLESLLMKHADSPSSISTVCCEFESFATDETFDIVLATFGSASYVNPEHIPRIERFLNVGGTYLAMFYDNGYYPITYERTGINAKQFDGGEEMLCGERTKFGKFIVVKGTRE